MGSVKAVTVWAFISREKRRGREGVEIEGEGKRETGESGVALKESLDTDSLVNWLPQRGRG